MKRIALLLLLPILLASSVSASSFYYSAAATGVSGKEAYGGLSLSAGFSFFDEPYLAIGTEVVLSPLFESVGVNISAQTPGLLNHPFGFMFANKVLYSPKLEIGAWYVYPDVWNMGVSLALLNFRDTSFSYEFFTPMLVMSMPDCKFGYGIKVLQVTCYL